MSGADGLDEMSTSAPTHVVEVKRGRHRALRGDGRRPRAGRGRPARGRGRPPSANAATARAVLEGEPGPRADLVLLNAGRAIYAGGRADTLAEGIDAAREAIASGAAGRTTEAYLHLSRELAPA